MKDKSIETLRKFFAITCAAFEMKRKIYEAFNGGDYPGMTKMETLHELANSQLKLDNPNMELIDEYLRLMEKEAELNSQ